MLPNSQIPWESGFYCRQAKKVTSTRVETCVSDHWRKIADIVMESFHSLTPQPCFTSELCGMHSQPTLRWCDLDVLL
jgi:hypothetical protein